MVETYIHSQLISGSDTFLGIGKNRIINGEMRVDQERAGGSLSITGGGTQFHLDMWASLCSAGSFSAQRSTSTPPAGFTHFLRLTTTSATASPGAADYFFTQHWIEGNNVRDFQWGSAFSSPKTVTLSFWVRSSLTGSMGGAVTSDNAAAYTFSYTINSANTWEYKTITIPGATIDTWQTGDAKSMRVIFDHGTGTNRQATAGSWTADSSKFTPPSMTRLVSTNSATWDLTGVQLELGSVASPFEYRPWGQEISLCQRYFEKSYELETAVATATSNAQQTAVCQQFAANSMLSAAIQFKVPKRTAPTVTLYNNAGTSGQWVWMNNTTTQTSRVTGTSSVGVYVHSFGVHQTVTSADAIAFGHYTASARMA